MTGSETKSQPDGRILLIGVALFVFSASLQPRNSSLSLVPHVSVLLLAAAFLSNGFMRVFKKSFLLAVFPFFLAAAVQFTGSQEISPAALFLKAWITIFSLTLAVDILGIPGFLTALCSTGFPAVIAGSLLFMFRYLRMFQDELERKNRAMSLRAFNGRMKLQILACGGILGRVWLGAFNRAERIYEAMKLRGYSGDFRRPERKFHVSSFFYLFSLLTLVLLCHFAGLKIGGAL